MKLIIIVSANRAISRDNIHCALALTAARPAMHKLVCYSASASRDYICFGKPHFTDVI